MVVGDHVTLLVPDNACGGHIGIGNEGRGFQDLTTRVGLFAWRPVCC